MTLPRKTTRFGTLQVAICVLALATAVVHIYLGVITNVMVATQPEARPQPVARPRSGSSRHCSISTASPTSC